MKRRNQAPEEPKQQEKVLDVSAAMQGTLKFDDPVNLKINSTFDGTLDTKGSLTIGEKAVVKANITGESVDIEGNVTGNIKASKILRLGRSAKLTGDVETASLAVQEGALIIGQIRMEGAGKASQVRSISGMDAAELAKYLEVEKNKVTEWATSGVIPGSKSGGEWTFDRDKIDEWVAQGRISK